MPSNAMHLGEQLPAPAAGHVWALVEGEPTQLADHRGTVFSTATGVAQRHDQLGELPDGFTTEPRPGPWYVWRSGEWALDEASQARDEKDQVIADIAARRYKAENGGTSSLGFRIDTDDRSKLLINGSVVEAMLNPDYVLHWKTREGFMPMTAEQVIAVGRAVRAHVQACFYRENELIQAVQDDRFEESMLDEGWPESS